MVPPICRGGPGPDWSPSWWAVVVATWTGPAPRRHPHSVCLAAVVGWPAPSGGPPGRCPKGTSVVCPWSAGASTGRPYLMILAVRGQKHHRGPRASTVVGPAPPGDAARWSVGLGGRWSRAVLGRRPAAPSGRPPGGAGLLRPVPAVPCPPAACAPGHGWPEVYQSNGRGLAATPLPTPVPSAGSSRSAARSRSRAVASAEVGGAPRPCPSSPRPPGPSWAAGRVPPQGRQGARSTGWGWRRLGAARARFSGTDMRAGRPFDGSRRRHPQPSSLRVLPLRCGPGCVGAGAQGWEGQIVTSCTRLPSAPPTLGKKLQNGNKMVAPDWNALHLAPPTRPAAAR